MLSQDFNDGRVNNDVGCFSFFLGSENPWLTYRKPDAPSQGFRFVNEARGAGAVVYKQVNGRNVPFYVSVDAPLPPGSEELTPIPKCAVWLQRGAQSETLIRGFQGNSQIIDFSGRNNARVKYGADGNWSVS